MSARGRNMRIEALRLVAIAGIAYFHSFQDIFAQAAGLVATGSAAGVAGDTLTSVASAPELAAGLPLLLGALGFVNLLGAFGNHVFFAISGCFLLPRAAARSGEAGYAADQARRTARRAAMVLATVAFYALITLAVDRWVVPITGVGEGASWLVGGLEFVWVYLVLVVATPIMGWLWRRLPAHRAVVIAFIVVVMAINAYIAFVSPGDAVRSLLEWRKLMSAVSYLASYMAGALVAEWWEEHRAVGEAAAKRAHGVACRLLVAVIIVAAALEVALAFAGQGALMVATSFKSTSLLSFLAAIFSLACALSASGGDGAKTSSTGSLPARATSLIASAAQGILGFYCAQSMFSPLWRPVAAALSASVLPLCSLSPVLAAVALLLVQLLFNAIFIAIVLVIDATVRRPLLRLLKLA